MGATSLQPLLRIQLALSFPSLSPQPPRRLPWEELAIYQWQRAKHKLLPKQVSSHGKHILVIQDTLTSFNGLIESISVAAQLIKYFVHTFSGHVQPPPSKQAPVSILLIRHKNVSMQSDRGTFISCFEIPEVPSLMITYVDHNKARNGLSAPN